MVKIGRSELLRVACVVSHRESENLKAVREMGFDASSGGVDYIEKYKGVIDIVFDCTSAAGHLAAAPSKTRYVCSGFNSRSSGTLLCTGSKLR